MLKEKTAFFKGIEEGSEEYRKRLDMAKAKLQQKERAEAEEGEKKKAQAEEEKKQGTRCLSPVVHCTPGPV